MESEKDIDWIVKVHDDSPDENSYISLHTRELFQFIGSILH